MKTWQAALAHIGLGALQVAAVVPYASADNQTGVLANTGIQIGAQMALITLQAWLARKNSNTDPKGNPLIQVSPNKYVSDSKPKE